MAQPDNAPDLPTEGGKPQLINEASQTVRVPGYFFEFLTDFDTLQAFREVLRDWYICHLNEHGSGRCDEKDLILFTGLDTLFSDLQRPALQREFSQHIKINIQP